MSDINVASLHQLARVDSANVFPVEFLGAPKLLLEVVAQRSGFNWKLNIQPGIVEGDVKVEYYPYLVVETKIGPGWPKHGGIGPVIPPSHLHTWVAHYGSKGIEVIGKDFKQKFDYPKA